MGDSSSLVYRRPESSFPSLFSAQAAYPGVRHAVCAHRISALDRVGVWSPEPLDLRSSSLGTMGTSTVTGPSSSDAPRCNTPSCTQTARPSARYASWPSGTITAWAQQKRNRISGLVSTAHRLVYLRIAAGVSDCGARLTTGLAGLSPDRAGFAPAGRQIGFQSLISP
jgi:hypothetical protein